MPPRVAARWRFGGFQPRLYWPTRERATRRDFAGRRLRQMCPPSAYHGGEPERPSMRPRLLKLASAVDPRFGVCLNEEWACRCDRSDEITHGRLALE